MRGAGRGRRHAQGGLPHCTRAHPHALVDVALVPNEDLVHVLVRVPLNLLYPRLDALKGRGAVGHEQRGERTCACTLLLHHPGGT